MTTADKKTLMTNVTALGYEVSAITDQNGGLVANPDGTFTKTDMTTIVAIKVTTFAPAPATV